MTGKELITQWLQSELKGDDDHAVQLRDDSASIAEFLEVVITTLSVVAKRRFSGDYDPRDITRLVLDTKDVSEMSDEVFAPMIVEATIRATLGERRLLEGIQLGTAIPALVSIVARLVVEDDLSDAEIDVLMSEVRELLARSEWA